MAADLSHILAFEIKHQYGLYLREEVVLFNSKRMTQEEAVNCAAAGEYNPNVLVLPKQQWISLFLDGKEE